MADPITTATVIYVFDTSSFVRPEELHDPTSAWAVIDGVIGESRIRIPKIVLDELGNVNTAAFTRLTRVREQIVAPLSSALLAEVGRIQYTYPHMCRPRFRFDIADPYVVALAKVLGSTVVTEESNHRRKMPGVCQTEGIPCIKLDQFLIDEK